MGTKGKRIDETGKFYGNLMVIEFSYLRKTKSGVNQSMWLCQCECGEVFEVRAGDLRRKDGRAIRSCKYCGPTRHSHCTGFQSSEYISWRSMKTRCQRQKDYISRNITVCEQWVNSFVNFLEDMGFKPDPSYTIERIDNNKGYEPGNCKWATRYDQSRNKRSNTKITINDRTMILADWIKESGVSIWKYFYLVKNGDSPEEALKILMYNKT